MARNESDKPVNNVVNVSTRKKHPGFVNPNKGIPVGEGCSIQDVPREVLIAHMRNTENMWKARFQQQYGGSHGGSQSF